MSPAALAERAKAHRYTLVLSGLAADPDPETGYLVFLNLSKSATPSKDDEGYVGASTGTSGDQGSRSPRSRSAR